MDFNSYIFILLFLPLVLLGYYVLRLVRRVPLAQYWIILASLVFIGYADVAYYPFLFVSAGVNFLCAFLQQKVSEKSLFKRLLMAFAIVGNVAILGYFKYSGFILANWNAYMGTEYVAKTLLVPIGISFWTFQQIAFQVDVNRGTISKLRVSDYLFYSFYFPKLVQGPIAKYQDLVSAFHDEKKRRFHTDMFACGLWFFVVGLAKKVLVADVLAAAVKWGYSTSVDVMTSMDAMLVVLCYSLQIYFDFSGYSHMAVGVSKMLNIDIMDNFDAPYQAKSIMEFWKRWHISLTTFLREYIYFPLGGSKKGKVRTYLNTMIIFLLSGLWHGASWTYVAWGAMHGVASCLNRMFHKQWEKLSGVVRWLFTFIFVNITWTFFRAPSVEYATKILGKVVRVDNRGVSDGLLETFRITEFKYLAAKFDWFNDMLAGCKGLEMVIFVLAALIISLNVKDRAEQFKPTVVKCVMTMVLFLWSVISLANVVEYIYGSF